MKFDAYAFLADCEANPTPGAKRAKRAKQNVPISTFSTFSTPQGAEAESAAPAAVLPLAEILGDTPAAPAAPAAQGVYAANAASAATAPARISATAKVLSFAPQPQHSPTGEGFAAQQSSRDDGMFRHGRSVTGDPKTWTGRIVSLDAWRWLSDWDRHGPDGRLWCGICRAWVAQDSPCRDPRCWKDGDA